MKLLKIGSNPSCDIVLHSDFVSAHHADLTLLDNGDIIIEDKNSTNGTFVSNKKIAPNQEVTVKRGDRIKIADEVLSWHKVPSIEDNSKYKSIVNIGSNFRNNIVINNPTVSRYHATLKILKGGKVFIVDNNSKNGTQVNGVKIVPGQLVRLKRGDNVMCGAEDVTARVAEFLKPVIPAWTWISASAVAAIAIIVGFTLWLWPSNVPNCYHNSVVYLRCSFKYKVCLKDNPLTDTNKDLLVKETSGIPCEATAFFLDKEGRMATTRHVAYPWAEEYRDEYLTQQLKQEYQKYLASELKITNLNVLDGISRLVAYDTLSQTVLGRALLDNSYDWADLQAKLSRIAKSEIVIDGEIDYITVGYPGRNYTHEDEFARCHVVCDSKDINIDLAILQLNDKKTPVDVKKVFSPEHFFEGKLIPQKDELFVWGYPHGISWNMNDNTSLEPNLKVTKCSKVPDKYEFEIQANTEFGSSGSPVFNKRGQLVGVLDRSRYGTEMTYAVMAKFLKKMYDEEVEH